MGDKLRDEEQRQRLRNSAEDLKYRLRDLFEDLDEVGEKPFLLVFDDFEWNLEPRQGDYILKSHVAQLLEALVWAIQETDAPHRIIITCRYRFQSDLLNFFFLRALDSFHHADLQKKLRRLENFNSDQISEALIQRALALAAGNPRLLEWLNNEVLSNEDAEVRLTQLESSSEDWKGKIIWDELYQQIDRPLKKILNQCLVYQVFVPMAAFSAVCSKHSQFPEQFQRGISLGLMEVSPELQKGDRLYRVSRISPHIIPSIQLPPDIDKFSSLHGKAWEILTQLWGNKQNKNEEKWREIFRLKFAEKENSERFREGFYQMLEVQYNQEADRAFEFELRKLKAELSFENLCDQLEDYLREENWRKADEETAWIFYQVMVLQKYEDWYELCRNFPSETLNEIDQLWVKYSDGHFGFSIQKQIWESVGSSPNAGEDTLQNFGKKIGWYRNNDWSDYNTLSFSKEFVSNVRGTLPALYATHVSRCVSRNGVYQFVISVGWRSRVIIEYFQHLIL